MGASAEMSPERTCRGKRAKKGQDLNVAVDGDRRKWFLFPFLLALRVEQILQTVFCLAEWHTRTMGPRLPCLLGRSIMVEKISKPHTLQNSLIKTPMSKEPCWQAVSWVCPKGEWTVHKEIPAKTLLSSTLRKFFVLIRIGRLCWLYGCKCFYIVIF